MYVKWWQVEYLSPRSREHGPELTVCEVWNVRFGDIDENKNEM